MSSILGHNNKFKKLRTKFSKISLKPNHYKVIKFAWLFCWHRNILIVFWFKQFSDTQIATYETTTEVIKELQHDKHIWLLFVFLAIRAAQTDGNKLTSDMLSSALFRAKWIQLMLDVVVVLRYSQIARMLMIIYKIGWNKTFNKINSIIPFSSEKWD